MSAPRRRKPRTKVDGALEGHKSAAQKTGLEFPRSLSLEELQEGLEAERQRRQEEEPLRYARLNEGIKRYAEAWCDPDKAIVLVPAPNGVGKSVGTIILMGWTMWPEYAPLWFSSLMAKKLDKMPRSFRMVSTVEESGDGGTLQQAIKQWWPRGRYRAEKQRKAHLSYFETDTGWIGDVMTYEQSKDEFEGATRALIVYNEPPPEDIRKACLFRTRMGGFEVFPMTPLANAAWISDQLVERALAGEKTIALVHIDLEEACRDHSPNGHLPHEKIEQLKREADPDEYEARINGRFMHLSGLIYKGFRHDVHVAKAPLESDPVAPKWMAVDPGGFGKPWAVGWGQVVGNPMHGLQFLREWPPGASGAEWLYERVRDPNMTLEGYAKMFSEVERGMGWSPGEPVRRVMDRRFGHVRDLRTGRSLRESLSELGYHFEDSYSSPEKVPELKMGIQVVRDYLAVDKLTKVPRLLLDPSCVNVRRAFMRWALDPKTFKPRDDVWKNMMDMARYACCASLLYEFSEPDAAWNPEGYGEPRWGTDA